MQKLIGFDIRKPGLLGAGAADWSEEMAPFRPADYQERACVTFDKYVNPSRFLHEEKNAERNISKFDGPIIASGENNEFDLFFPKYLIA